MGFTVKMRQPPVRKLKVIVVVFRNTIAFDIFPTHEVEELNNVNGGGAGLGGDDDNVFELTRAYVTAFSGTRDPTYKKEEVRALKLKLQEKEFVRFSEQDHSELDPAVLEPFEIAALCDLKVEAIDEVKELIPSIRKRFDDSDIEAMLDMIKASAARA